jgi:hypothetical protein
MKKQVKQVGKVLAKMDKKDREYFTLAPSTFMQFYKTPPNF